MASSNSPKWTTTRVRRTTLARLKVIADNSGLPMTDVLEHAVKRLPGTLPPDVLPDKRL